ncbi:MAG: prolyl oligopeptidase family protein [Candidatus Thorarchaeota archaeon]
MKIAYPKTKRDDVIDDYHGVKVVDSYRWLEDISLPEVQNWIEKQNQLSEQVLNSYFGRDIVRKRTKELLEHESISNLAIRNSSYGTRFFYTLKQPNVNQPVLCYQDGEEGKRIVISNPNKLNTDGSISIDWFFPSWDGQYVAYGVSESGTEESVLYVYDITNSKHLQDEIPRTRWADVAWNTDNSGFYYTRYPLPGSVSAQEMNYNKHVYFHQLGTDYKDDSKVFGVGRDPAENCHVYTNQDNEWVLLIASRFNSADIYLARKTDDWNPIPLIESNDALCWAYLSKDSVFLITFLDAPNGRIIKFKLNAFSNVEDNPDSIVVVDEGEDAINRISTSGYLSYTTLKNASSVVHIHDLESGEYIDCIEFPSPVTVNSITACPRTHKLYLSVSSYTYPDSIHIYDIESGLDTFFSPKVNLEPNRFKVEQIWYRSKDNTNVPMFLISDSKTCPSEKTPVLVRGYGNGGISYTPMFFPEYMIWLEKGGVLAIPNIRGGGEYGENWHKYGSREYKQNTYDDFISAIEWLHANGYGNPKTTAIMGRSAGGLLVGAVLVQRPDLFSSVYCAVPLLDMLRYTKFTVAKLWMSEYGNPEMEDEFQWIYPISPYHNVIDGLPYPAVLFYTALGDIRCDPSHAMKMAARVQESTSNKIEEQPILLSVNREAGHGVGLSIKNLVEIRTKQVIFFAKHTGLNWN